MHLLVMESRVQPSMGIISAAAGFISITPEGWGADGNCPGVCELIGMAGDALEGLF